MANRYYNPWAGLPQIGARIGGAIQRKGEQKRQTWLEQLRQQEERRYQESTPQWQTSIQQLRDMEEAAKTARELAESQAKVEENKAKLWPMIHQFWDVETPKTWEPQEKRQMYGVVQPGKGYAETRTWLDEYMAGREKTELGKRKTEAEIAKLKRPPTGEKPKVLSATQQIKVQDEVQYIFGGVPPEISIIAKTATKEEPWGEKEVERMGSLGLIEKTLGVPLQVAINPQFSAQPKIRVKIWNAWNRIKATKAPAVRKAGDEWMINYFGPRAGQATPKTISVKQRLITAYGADWLREQLKQGKARGLSNDETLRIIANEANVK